MENALLIGLSRQSALRNQLNVVANNLANMNTAGFKSQRLLFEEYLMPDAEASHFRRGDRVLSYVVDYGASSDFSAGAVFITGNPLDVAIEGDGWFVVQAPEGEHYTRAGSFHLDSTGQLVTASGNPVLTEGGPVHFTVADGAITIAKDGTISTEQGEKGRLRVVDFDDPDALRRVGDNLFAGEDPRPLADVRVLQGAVERSNVQGVVEITRMIEITRNYETVSKMISQGDELLRKAIDALGSVQA